MMTETPDFQATIDKVREMLSSEDGENQIAGLLNSLKTAGNNEAPAEGSVGKPAEESMGQLNSILSGLGSNDVLAGLKNIMGSGELGAKDKSADFLEAIKPFLKKERQSKIDSAAKALSALKAFKLFKDSGLGGV